MEYEVELNRKDDYGAGVWTFGHVLTVMPGSLVPGMLLLGSSFLCGGRGLPSGLASALLLEELSLLSSDSSLGISSQNLW